MSNERKEILRYFKDRQMLFDCVERGKKEDFVKIRIIIESDPKR